MIDLVWTVPAVADLEAVRRFVARDSPIYASALVARLLGSVARLAAFPRSGRVVPELRQTTIREVIVASYRIVYRLRPGRVEVIAIVHAARDLGRAVPASRRR